MASISRASACAVLSLALSAGATMAATPAVTAPGWVATWQASPQPVWGGDFLFPTNVPVVLNDQTVRQVSRISVGGPRLRIVLSNAYGSVPVRIDRDVRPQPFAQER